MFPAHSFLTLYFQVTLDDYRQIRTQVNQHIRAGKMAQQVKEILAAKFDYKFDTQDLHCGESLLGQVVFLAPHRKRARGRGDK